MSVQLTFGAVNFAKLSVAGLQGIQKIGGYGLAFNLRIDTAAWAQSEQAVTIESWSAMVMCSSKSGAPKLLGKAYPVYPQIIKTYKFPNDSSVQLLVDLTAEQLALLEAARAGGDLTFKLDIRCHCVGQVGSDPEPGSDVFHPTYRTWTSDQNICNAVLDYDTTINEWQKVLKELDFLDLMVFSISLPSKPASKELQPAQRMLRQAQDHFLHGRYEDVVSASRKLMESIRDALGQDQAIKDAARKFKEDRQSMSKSERSLVVQESVRHYSQLAHHVDKATGSPEWYSRADAMFILATSSAVFAEALARVRDD